FDKNIVMTKAKAFSVKGTTWSNVHYASFKAILVEYRNGTKEYFLLDDIGNFYYGEHVLGILDHAYLKRGNGLVYPILNGRIYFNEVLTPNIISLKNGLTYQVKELQDLYELLQIAGTFSSILGMYAVGDETFKTSIEAFVVRTPTTVGRGASPLSGSPMTRSRGGQPEPGVVEQDVVGEGVFGEGTGSKNFKGAPKSSRAVGDKAGPVIETDEDPYETVSYRDRSRDRVRRASALG